MTAQFHGTDRDKTGQLSHCPRPVFATCEGGQTGTPPYRECPLSLRSAAPSLSGLPWLADTRSDTATVEQERRKSGPWNGMAVNRAQMAAGSEIVPWAPRLASAEIGACGLFQGLLACGPVSSIHALHCWHRADDRALVIVGMIAAAMCEPTEGEADHG